MIKRLIHAMWGAGLSDWAPVIMCPKSNSLVALSFSEYQAHIGNKYFVKTQADIAVDTTYFMFRTPDTTTRIHARAQVSTEGEFITEIFENPTLSADGTPIAGMNCDRDSSNTAELLPFAGPTVSDAGDLIWSARTGSNKDATVSEAQKYEIIAARDTDYLFRLTKVAAGTLWIDVDFWWHEHAPQR